LTILEEVMPSGNGAHKTIYLGHTIELAPHKITIDGEEVHYEESEDYIYSHEMAFRHYGSREELAQDIARQWGTAKIEHGRPHPHEKK
jgi:hypothetical protein